MIFDLLCLDGHSLMELPYDERRAALAELELDGPDLAGAGAPRRRRRRAAARPTRAQGLEGVIAKRLDCPYVPGRRSQGWVKVKNVRRDRRRDRRLARAARAAAPGRLGALVVGYHDEDGELRYAGRVGTGFNDGRARARLGRLLEPLAPRRQPVHGPPAARS